MGTTLDSTPVRYAYFWVHPQWNVPWDTNLAEGELRQYTDFIERIRQYSDCAVVQIPGEPQFDNSASREWVEQLRRFDKYAASQLGHRYHVFNKAYFFDGRVESHVDQLVNVLGLEKRDQTEFVTPDELSFGATAVSYLARAFVFGKELDTCPLEQAYNRALHKLATSVRYYSLELPERIDPKVNKNWSSGDHGILVTKRVR